ncbi:MAG: 50S ribosomal protein L6 [Acidobacteriota bacterium]
MSRIGKLPVAIPSGVSVKLEGRHLEASGPKGNLNLKLTPHVKLAVAEQELRVSPTGDTPLAQQQWGLTRTLVANLVQGVSEGWQKQLEIHGVGYRVQAAGRVLNLSLGYSHPIEFKLPAGVDATVEGNTIILSGADKQQVGQAAAEIRSLRKPEPYKGKGIRYVGEQIRRKAGKAAAAKGAAS